MRSARTLPDPRPEPAASCERSIASSWGSGTTLLDVPVPALLEAVGAGSPPPIGIASTAARVKPATAPISAEAMWLGRGIRAIAGWLVLIMLVMADSFLGGWWAALLVGISFVSPSAHAICDSTHPGDSYPRRTPGSIDLVAGPRDQSRTARMCTTTAVTLSGPPPSRLASISASTASCGAPSCAAITSTMARSSSTPQRPSLQAR